MFTASDVSRLFFGSTFRDRGSILSTPTQRDRMKILIIQQGTWARKFGIPLIDFLHENLPAADFAAVIVNPVARADVEASGFPYEKIWDRSAVDDEVLLDDFGDRYSHISMSDVERELGIESVWMRLIYAQRSLVYTPGVKHRYSWDQQIDDDVCLDVVRSSFVAVKAIFDEWGPDLIITPNYVSLFHNCLYYYAKRQGVGMWRVNSTRISGHYILTDDNVHRLEHVVDRFRRSDTSDEAVLFARDYLKKYRCEYIPPENFANWDERLPETRLARLAKLAIRRFYKIPALLLAMWRQSRSKDFPRLYRTIGNLPFWLQVRNSVIGLLYARATGRLPFHQPKPHEQYVYFPLQFQPEETIMLWAPYWNNQIELARQVAMSLPEGLTLYVKDHPTMIGRRSPSYLEKIMRTPNVKLVDPLYPSQNLFMSQNCRAVVSLAGSTGFEAMLAGKPILLFADMYYDALPHCEKITELAQINAAVRRLLQAELTSPEFDEQLIRFIAAIKDESFEINYASMWGLNKQGDKTPFYEAYLDLIRREIDVKADRGEDVPLATH